jgi:HJR/Mrr/RecB family endonuclease
MNKQGIKEAVLGFMVIGIVLSFMPVLRCLTPIMVGAIIGTVGDIILKKMWCIEDEKWSSPASWGWLFFTCFSMLVVCFLVLLVDMDEIPTYSLIIATITYFLISFLILFKKHNKVKNKVSKNTSSSNCVISEYCDEIDPTDVFLIDGMDGHEFEYFCADILEKNGFTNVSVTRGSGDQGVDVLATKDGIKYAIQCKNYESSLGNTPIQEVNAGKMFYRCHVGVVMTNSRFTPGAKALAEVTGTLLWDRTDLQNMMNVKK